jgi:hypothetical protein
VVSALASTRRSGAISVKQLFQQFAAGGDMVIKSPVFQQVERNFK